MNLNVLNPREQEGFKLVNLLEEEFRYFLQQNSVKY